MKNLDSNELFKIIGKHVKYYRKLYNLQKGKMTQEQLAELANVSTALIGNLESEKIPQGISVYTLWKISQILDVPIENLFENPNYKNRKII